MLVLNYVDTHEREVIDWKFVEKISVSLVPDKDISCLRVQIFTGYFITYFYTNDEKQFSAIEALFKKGGDSEVNNYFDVFRNEESAIKALKDSAEF